MVAFRRPCDMVDLKYVLMRRIAEKDLSLIALVAGITTNKRTSLTTSAIKSFSPTDMPFTRDRMS